MWLSIREVWDMGQTIAQFDRKTERGEDQSAHSNVIYIEWFDRSLALCIRMGDTPVFDAYWDYEWITVRTFRRGAWLVKYDELWRQAETKRRLQKYIDRRKNFDHI
ncbi:hypothetical protein LCGC14_2660450 [marine sediment metagenome]|uniref:Uncharacterized protein n=1 Tax=marine sediment metagenome TaxID=412755 RepID=A0A0F9C299_9ZZZZ